MNIWITLWTPSLLFNCEIKMLTKSNLLIFTSPNSPWRKGVTISILPFYRRGNWRIRHVSESESTCGTGTEETGMQSRIYFGAPFLSPCPLCLYNKLGSPGIALWYNRRNLPLPIRRAEQGGRSLESVRTGTPFSPATMCPPPPHTLQSLPNSALSWTLVKSGRMKEWMKLATLILVFEPLIQYFLKWYGRPL